MKKSEVGVYAFTNIVSGFRYIGQSVDMQRRKRQHLRALTAGVHHASYFQNSFSVNGPDCFEYSVLEYCQEHELTVTEQKWIDHFKETGIFNSAPAAGSAKGIIRSAETRIKMSLAMTGKKHSDEHRKNLSAARMGVPTKPCKESTKQAIGAANSGKKPSNETREKLRAANLGKIRGPNSKEVNARISAGNLGKTISAETRAKISLANTGRVPSEEARLKMSQAKLGKTKSSETRARMAAAQQKPRNISAETREKMRLAKVGAVLSQETRNKISAAGTGRVMPAGSLAKAWETRRRNKLEKQLL